jgi:hypothetical protein
VDHLLIHQEQEEVKLDLTKLSEAVTAVAGVAAERDYARAERDALLEDQRASQEAVDALTVSLIAATSSPAGAVGLAAVAAALDPETVNQSIANLALRLDPVTGVPIK